MRTTFGAFAAAIVLVFLVQNKLSAFKLTNEATINDAANISNNRQGEGKLALFLGETKFDLNPLFKNEIFS